MPSISEQLASYRDVKNKTLRRFQSEYRSKLPWNTVNVSKSYYYLRSVDDDFEKYESLFSDSLFGLSSLSLSLSDNNTDSNIDIFRESKDVEFMTSEELSELNKLLGSFIEHTVQYFMNENTQILIDYLIFKYEIASSFADQLIASYIQYYNSPYFCKLLSLFSIERGSGFYSLHERIKDVSLDFTESKYVTLNLVISEILKSYTAYKAISSVYNKLSRSFDVNINTVSFYNFVNSQYILTNGPSILDNELRYIINMVMGGLKLVDNVEYINCQMCSMLSIFSSVQLHIPVQKEMINSCRVILNKINSMDTIPDDYILTFKTFILVIVFMLHNQTQPLEKLTSEITVPLLQIMCKKSVREVFVDIKESQKSLDFSIFTNLLFYSLVTHHLNKNSEEIEQKLQKIDYETSVICDIKNFLQFVKETFDSNCIKQIVLKIVYELNKLNSMIKSHKQSMINFRIDELEFSLNPEINHKAAILLLGHSIEIMAGLSPNTLEATLLEYLLSLEYDDLRRNIEVILYIYHRKSNDIYSILLILYNRYANKMENFTPIKDAKLNSMHLCLSIFEKMDLQKLNEDSALNSFIDFLVYTYETRKSLTEFNFYLSNFLHRLTKYPELLSKLYSSERFIGSVPSIFSLNSLLYNIKTTIDDIDDNYKCHVILCKDEVESGDIVSLLIEEFVLHLMANRKLVEDLFKNFELFFKIYSKADESSRSIVSDGISPFINFIKFTSLSTKNIEKYKEVFKVDFDFEIQRNDYDLVTINNNLIRIMKNIIMNDSDLSYNVDLGVEHVNGIFSPFCGVFYLIKTIEHVIKEESEVEYTQMVLIMDLVIKYTKNTDVSESIKRFIYEVYRRIFHKYESDLCKLHSKFSPIITAKRLQIILTDEKLYKEFKTSMFDKNKKEETGLSKLYQYYYPYVFELFRICTKSHKHNEFKVLFYKENGELKMRIMSPSRFKYYFTNLEYNKFVKDSIVIQLLSKNYVENENQNPNNEQFRIELFDNNNNGVIVDKGCDFVLKLFDQVSKYATSAVLFMDLLINSLDFIYTPTTEYSGQFSKLIYDLGKKCKNKKVDQDKLRVTMCSVNEFRLDEKNYAIQVDLKHDIKKLLSDLRKQDVRQSGSEVNLISLIESNIVSDEQLFKLFMTNLFTSGSKCMFNTVYLDKVIKLIDESEYKVSFLTSILYQFGLMLQSDLVSVEVDDHLVSNPLLYKLSEFLSFSIVLLETKKIAEDELELGLLSNLIMKIGVRYKKLESKLEESSHLKCDNFHKIVKYLGNQVDDTCLLVLRSFKSGVFWKVPEELRNCIYSSFVQLSRYSKAKYISNGYEWLFTFKETDEFCILVFFEGLLKLRFRENVVTYLIGNLKTLNSYELLVHILLSSSLGSNMKLIILCKIVHQFLISIDLSDKSSQTFILRHTNVLLEQYSKLCQDPNGQDDLFKNYLNKILDKQFNDLCGNKLQKRSFVSGIINMITGQNNDKSKDAVVAKMLDTISKDAMDLDDSEDLGFKDKMELDSNELNVVFSNIVMYLKQLLDRIHKMFEAGSVEEKKVYTSFYHSVCLFINKSISILGVESVKFINKLIHTLMACDVRLTLSNREDFEEVLRNSVTSTVNNILDFGDNTLRLIEELLNGCKGIYDKSVVTVYTSYLIYTYVYTTTLKTEESNTSSKYDKIMKIVNKTDQYFSVLTTIIFINLKMLDSTNKNEVNFDKLKGYQILDFKGKNKLNRVSEQVSTELFRLIISDLFYPDMFKIELDLSFFTKQSPKALLFIKINQFLYSLLSTMVYYKHYYEKFNNPRNKITENSINSTNESRRIKTGETGSTNISDSYEMITNLILHIFRINSVGGFNLHVYEILKCVYDNSLEKVNIADGKLSTMMNERYHDNIFQFKWDMYVITNMLWLTNMKQERLNEKENSLRFKYEKELDQINTITCQVMFELFRVASDVYELNEDGDLFNDITYFRNEVWIYFINNTPSSIDHLIHILGESLDRFELNYLEDMPLNWSGLDTVYSLKLVMAIRNKSGLGKGINDNYDHNKINKIAEKTMKISRELIFDSHVYCDFVQMMILLLCYLLLKYFKVSLKREFYEFCMELVLEYKSKENTGMVEIIDENTLNKSDIENEFMGLHIDDCLKALENTDAISLKFLKKEVLMAQITYYTSQSIDVKMLIKSFSSIREKQDDGRELIVRVARLLKVLSLNIKYVKPKKEYNDDLKNIYFICVRHYNKLTYEVLFGLNPDLGLYNTSQNKSTEDNLANSSKLSSGLFYDNYESDLVWTFEDSFLSFALNYFSLISSNELVDLFEKHTKICHNEIGDDAEESLVMENDVGNRNFLLVTLTAISEYGKYGATNLISTRLSQHFEQLSEYCLNEAKINRKNLDQVVDLKKSKNFYEITFDNCLTWFKNSKLLLELVEKSIDTWNINRGSVPDVLLNSWCKIVKNHISILDCLPINGDVKVHNVTSELLDSIERAITHLINGFITQDEKIIKIESCLSEQLALKSLNIKIGCLVMMDHIWEELGVHLTPTIKNVMPLLGELVDDENDVVRRIAAGVDAKVKEVLYQN